LNDFNYTRNKKGNRLMKQRVADFIAEYLADSGITHVFSVVGGGAMHLNNAFGTNRRLSVTYNHHEQASAIAAESYSRISNRLAAVCVTSGPGGTNALTGVLCAYQDSLPVLVVSGQVRYDITVESTGLNLRQFGEQEFQIVKSAAPMTKYAVMVKDAKTIKYHLGKAIHLARTGRRGPCWVDVPMNIQGQLIETDELSEYTPDVPAEISNSIISTIIGEIQRAERPVVIAGSGMRTSGCLSEFYELVQKLKLPVICPTSIVDTMAPSDEHYYGMFGSFGGRCGNFIVQNADLFVVLGARLSFKQIGFNYEKFAPVARKIIVDVDAEELRKPTVHIDIPIFADVADVVHALNSRNLDCNLNNKRKWLDYCDFLKQKFIENTPKREFGEDISAYQFAEMFFEKAGNRAIAVLGNNCAAVSILQTGIKQRGQRLFGNVNCGTMGYDLPAAIGAAIASGGTAYCLTGEGSFQMNLQELQTVVHNNLPVKIVIFNNNSYQAIVQTQTNFFDGVLAGCTNDSGVSFPSFEKLAYAYGYPFRSIIRSDKIADALDWLISQPSRAILELVQTVPDPIMPKLSSKKFDDGTMVSPPIDDISPFLSETEYKECQFENFAGGAV
jgi:acetolactate synthase-1/2/3 large subunit